MQLTKSIIVAAIALFAGTMADNTIDQFSDNDCQSYVTTYFEPGDGGCQPIDNSKSVRVTGLNGGCSVTGYSDSSCSNNPGILDIGACIINTASFSVDCGGQLRRPMVKATAEKSKPVLPSHVMRIQPSLQRTAL